MTNGETDRPRNVAVIAVHGVADQKPHVSARVIADVLSSVDAGHTYRAFEERPVRIPVRELKCPPPATVLEDDTKPSLMKFQPSSPVFKPKLRGHREPDDAAHEYMKHQLSRYRAEGDDQVYDTIRLESVRSGRACRVHVYEAYWADLSRVSSAIWSAVLELYQLMFYVCNLGRKALDFAKDRNPSRWWSVLAWAQTVTEWLLVLGIPILNLIMLALSVALVTIKVPDTPVWQAGVGAGVVALMSAAAVALAMWLRRSGFEGARWPLTGFVVALLAVAGGLDGRLLFVGDNAYRLLGGLVFVLLTVPLLWLFAAYQKRRTGAFVIGVAVLVATMALFAWRLCDAGRLAIDERARFVTAVLWMIELALLAITVDWLLMMLGLIVTVILGGCAVRFGTQEARRPAARRALFTANLAIVLPALVVLVLNLALWGALHAGGVKVLCEFTPSAAIDPAKPCEGAASLRHEPAFHPGDPGTAGDRLATLVHRSMRLLVITGPLAGFALLLAAWSLLPAIAGEVPRFPGGSGAKARWLGESLSAGYRAMRVSSWALNVMFLLLFVAGTSILIERWRGRPLLSFLADSNLPTVSPALAALLGGFMTAALTISRGPFRFLALGARSAMDVALDVTNWLRILPLEQNPRARICARYVSLLREICRWRDPVDSSGYDAIVIVAHSQGAVITADLLRFLEREMKQPDFEPELARLTGAPADRLPIWLFTMGCPLRQLYSLRLPDLYAWARHDDGEWPGSRPEPKELGVRLWANAYRSGDYVGRYLWFPDAGDDRWGDTPSKNGNRIEVCLGPGAHTHYWNRSAPQVATILDDLIGRACAP